MKALQIVSLALLALAGAWLGFRLGKPSPLPQPTRSVVTHRHSLDLTRTGLSSKLKSNFARLAKADRQEKRLDNKALNRALHELIEQDPRAAVSLIQEHFHGLKRSHAYFTLIEQWGRQEPEATLAFIAGLDASEDVSSNVHNATTGFLHEWAERDAEAAINAWLALPDPKLANESSISYSAECLARGAAKIPKMREMALSLLLDQPSSTARASALAGVVATWAQRTPFADITQWLESQDLEGDETTVIAVQAATTAVQEGNGAAADWLLEQVFANQASPSDRANHLDNFAEEWAREDPDACGKWLSTLQPSRETDWAIRGFLRRVEYVDPASGFLWTREITDQALRQRLTRDLWNAWRRQAPGAVTRFRAQLSDEESAWLSVDE